MYSISAFPYQEDTLFFEARAFTTSILGILHCQYCERDPVFLQKISSLSGLVLQISKLSLEYT